MLLTIDVGNSQTIYGVFGDDGADEPRNHWRTGTNTRNTSDELAFIARQLLRGSGLFPDDLHGIAIASSVPSVTAALRRTCTEHLGLEPVVIGPGVRTGMPIRYDNPREVGADRIANSVGAFARYGGPSIVVDFGTATTFDVISGDGQYLGGAIVPGVEVAMDGLLHRAAGLHRVELTEPKSVVATSTNEAMLSGIVFGTAEMVDGMCRRIQREVGPGPVIAAGGLAPLIVPHSEAITEHDQWITLWGLRTIWERNQT